MSDRAAQGMADTIASIDTAEEPIEVNASPAQELKLDKLQVF